VVILDVSATVSIALPGSIINNPQTLQLKSCLVDQIARSAAIFRINEIVIYNENSISDDCNNETFNPNEFFCRILQYLETPQYLRKALFGIHPHLKYAGILNPLDAPHHMRANEDCEYREGLVLDATSPSGDTFVDCGLSKNVLIDKSLEVGTRVTVKMKAIRGRNPPYYGGKIVSPSTPTVESGIYWGYTVRYAKSFSEVFTQSTYKVGYWLLLLYVM
jgi:predicted SPOUT superfamily RNA methylase MTH1